MTRSGLCLALAFALLGCRERYRPSLDAEVSRTPDVAAVADVADVSSPDVPLPSSARVTVVEVTGGVTIDTSLRCAGTPGTSEMVPASVGRSLFACDRCEVGEGSALTLSLDGGATVVMGAASTVEPAGYDGAALTLSRGTAEITVPMLARDPARIDTPAGRLIVASGTALVTVADDGSVRVSVDEGGTMWWPSPPAPPARATSLSPSERRRLALASPGHPVLLDVDLPELAAGEVRAVTARPFDASASVAFSPSGAPLPGALARLRGEALRAAVTQWRAMRDRGANRRDAHLVAIEELSRAGAGDVADVRVALAQLRTRRDLTTRDRETLLARVSLALGRLTARARRGRALATRGGNVTALVQTAPLEALREAAGAR